MLPSDVAGVRSAAEHNKHHATVPRVVATAVQEEARLLCWLRFKRPFHMVTARFEKWEKSRERCPTAQRQERRQHVRFDTHLHRHNNGITRGHVSFHSNRLCLSLRYAAEQTGGSRQDPIAASKTRAIPRSTMPSYFADFFPDVYSRRKHWWFSRVTNSTWVNLVPLSNRRNSTMDWGALRPNVS